MHNFPAFYSPYATGFSPSPFGGFMLALLPFIVVIAVWTILIKGYALWHAARAGQKGWFIALLVINTLGILEIVYLIWFRPNSSHSHHPHTPAHESSPQA
jgi:methionyl-tRNA synthetase